MTIELTHDELQILERALSQFAAYQESRKLQSLKEKTDAVLIKVQEAMKPVSN